MEEQPPEQKFKIEPLGDSHDRAAFSCGSSPALDRYLQERAGQDMKKSLAAVFVITPDGSTIAGYYTLSTCSVILDEIPEPLRKKLTKMPIVPTTLIGRLARSVNFKGLGIGELLLLDALKRGLMNSANVASWATIADAKDVKAKAFYQRYGFLELVNIPNRLFLPMQTVARLFT